MNIKRGLLLAVLIMLLTAACGITTRDPGQELRDKRERRFRSQRGESPQPGLCNAASFARGWHRSAFRDATEGGESSLTSLEERGIREASVLIEIERHARIFRDALETHVDARRPLPDCPDDVAEQVRVMMKDGETGSVTLSYELRRMILREGRQGHPWMLDLAYGDATTRRDALAELAMLVDLLQVSNEDLRALGVSEDHITAVLNLRALIVKARNS